jgi:hypothetical protein
MMCGRRIRWLKIRIRRRIKRKRRKTRRKRIRRKKNSGLITTIFNFTPKSPKASKIAFGLSVSHF